MCCHFSYFLLLKNRAFRILVYVGKYICSWHNGEKYPEHPVTYDICIENTISTRCDLSSFLLYRVSICFTLAECKQHHDLCVSIVHSLITCYVAKKPTQIIFWKKSHIFGYLMMLIKPHLLPFFYQLQFHHASRPGLRFRAPVNVIYLLYRWILQRHTRSYHFAVAYWQMSQPLLCDPVQCNQLPRYN